MISAFEISEVRYALAGGFAVALYGRIRATKDIDLLCHPVDLDKACRCLEQVGYKKYADSWTFRNSAITLHRYMKPSGEPEMFHVIDLLVPPEDKLHWIQNASRIAWGEKITVAVVSRADLTEMKRLRNSAVDQADIAYLEGG